MGYELNADAYKLFNKLEVGIREFLIEIIKLQGVEQWFSDFLGTQQRDSLNVIVKRIAEAERNQQQPSLADQYLFKLDRSLKINETNLSMDKLYHPFYYLNWVDMENLMRMKANYNCFENVIGKINKEAIMENLKSLNNLRNDIAHSRFISQNDFIIIESCYEQIVARIPNFNSYINNQTNEDTLGSLLKKLKGYILLIESKEVMEIEAIENVISFNKICLNSFWLNSLNNQIIYLIKKLQNEMTIYYQYRKTIGGLLEIEKWKRNNDELLNNLKNIINDGKF